MRYEMAAVTGDRRHILPDADSRRLIADDPRADDGVTVAEAVRKVAYMINVPHAFTPEYPADETKSVPCKTPVILNAYDGYMAGGNAFDFAIDVEAVFPRISEMTFCHRSQISEWLPWVGRHRFEAPKDIAEWAFGLRARLLRQNRELGIHSERAFEVFTVTAWGSVPKIEQLISDLPNVSGEFSNLPRLAERLARWRGES